jgi:GNAT superfamily N-acetyltransferase
MLLARDDSQRAGRDARARRRRATCATLTARAVAVAGCLERLVDLELHRAASAVPGERRFSHGIQPTLDVVPITFRPVPLDEEPAHSLVVAMREEIAQIYEGVVLDGPEMPKAGPRELGPPGGVFLVGYDEGDAPVCGGGIKDLGDGACEIKRMYVVPGARNAGFGRELLDALEEAARGLG